MDARTQKDTRLGEDTTPALTLSGISRQFGIVRAVDDISLDVQQGDHLSCRSFWLRQDLAFADYCRDRCAGRRSACHGWQDAGQLLHLCGTRKTQYRRGVSGLCVVSPSDREENVLFGLRGMRKDEAKARVDELLALVGLASMADRYPHMLSGGEQQRVALIRALAPKPDLLLMDEPFSNLDRGLRARVRSETIALLRALGTPVIIVTHEAEEALSTGDRVVLMRSGKIVQAGSARELHNQPATRYAADFFCDFNALEGKVNGCVVQTPVGVFMLPADIRLDGDVAVYLRPRDIEVVSCGASVKID